MKPLPGLPETAGGGRAEKFSLAAVAGLLLFLAFFPLLRGRNCLPFNFYPSWGGAVARENGVPYDSDELFEVVSKTAPGLREKDQSGLSVHLPAQSLFASAVRGGDMALWDPYVGCGMPTFHGGQFRPFNPVLIPFYIEPTALMLTLGFLFSALAGLFFMFLFLRDEGLGFPAAMFGALFFVLNPFSMSRLSLLDFPACMLYPLILYSFRRLRDLSPLSIASAAAPLVVACNVGHPETCLIGAVLGTLYFLFRCEGDLVGKLKRISLTALVTSVAVSFYVVPPLIQYMESYSYKEGVATGFNRLPWSSFFTPFSDMAVLPVSMALIFLHVWKPGRRDAFFLGFLAAALLLVMPLPYLERSLLLTLAGPMVPQFYIKFVMVFVISCLCAAGVQKLADGTSPWLPASAFVVSFAAFLWVNARLPFSASEFVETERLIFAAIAMQGSLLGIAFLGKIRGEVRRAGAAAFLVAVALLPYPVLLETMFVPWNGLEIRTPDYCAFVSKELPGERVVAPFAYPGCLLPPNYGSVHSVRQAEANAVMFPNLYHDMFGKGSLYPTFVNFTEPDYQSFVKTGATLIILPKESALSGPTPVYEGRNGLVYRLEGAKGRFFFADGITVREGGPPTAQEVLAQPEGSVMVEGGTAGLEGVKKPEKTGFTISSDSPDEVSAEITSAEKSFFVLRDTFHSRWKAYLDGRETVVYRVDGCFRGVVIPPGGHSLVFRFEPVELYLTAAVSIAATFAVVLTLIMGLAVKRKEPGRCT